MSYYAVAIGRDVGVFMDWESCKASVDGYPHAKYKKFKSKSDAMKFIEMSSKLEQATILDFFGPAPAPVLASVPAPVLASVPASMEETFDVEDNESTEYVYTDGACSNNGRAGSARCGIGVWFGEDDPRNVSKALEGKQTNNVAELAAVIEACGLINHELMKGKSYTIVSDSEYTERCISTYGYKCKMNGWSDPIPNKLLVRKAYDYFSKYTTLKFKKVRAHTNGTDKHAIGNMHADRLAVASINS